MPPIAVYGYDVTILIDVCKAIIAADVAGTLLRRQATMELRVFLGRDQDFFSCRTGMPEGWPCLSGQATSN